MSTHNLCFEAKRRKIGIPLFIPVLLYKSGVYGVYITRKCYTDFLSLAIWTSPHGTNVNSDLKD